MNGYDILKFLEKQDMYYVWKLVLHFVQISISTLHMYFIAVVL
jgi:hypothetical protein